MEEEHLSELANENKQPRKEYKIPEFFTKRHAKLSVILLVEGQEIYASKHILKLASPVFEDMLEQNSCGNDIESIELTGKTCQGVVLLLSCIYPNMLEQIDGVEVQDKLDRLLVTATEYKVDKVLNLCEDKYLLMFLGDMQRFALTSERIVELLHVADKYHFNRFCVELCKTAVYIKLDELEKVEEYEALSVETRFKIVNTKLAYMQERCKSKPCKIFECDEGPSKSKYLKLDTDSKADVEVFQIGTSPLRSLIIKIGSQNLFASKEVLALSSPVFRDQIEAIENQEEPLVLDFSSQNYDDFVCLLSNIHPDTSSGVNDCNVRRLLQLADVFKVRKLSKDCDDVLEKMLIKFLSTPTVNIKKIGCVYAQLATKYKLPRVRELSCKVLAGLDIEEITDPNLDVPEDVRVTAISNRILEIEKNLKSYKIPFLYKTVKNEPVSVKGSNGQAFVENFTEDSINDVSVVVQGNSLYVDEDILSLASPVFKKELDNVEGDSSPKVIQIDTTEDDFKVLLRCIYPNTETRLGVTEALSLLQFVDSYQIESVCKPVEKVFILSCLAEERSSEEIVDYITTANKYNMFELLKTCKQTLKKLCGEERNTDLYQKKRFDALRLKILQYITHEPYVMIDNDASDM